MMLKAVEEVNMKIIVDRVSVSAEWFSHKTEYEVSERNDGRSFLCCEEDSYSPSCSRKWCLHGNFLISIEQGLLYKNKEMFQSDALLKTIIEEANGDDQALSWFTILRELFKERKE